MVELIITLFFVIPIALVIFFIIALASAHSKINKLERKLKAYNKDLDSINAKNKTLETKLTDLDKSLADLKFQSLTIEPSEQEPVQEPVQVQEQETSEDKPLTVDEIYIQGKELALTGADLDLKADDSPI